MPKVVCYQDASEAALWRYRFVADNNEIFHASHRGWIDRHGLLTNMWVLLRTLDDHFENGLAEVSSGEVDASENSFSTLHVINSTDGWRWYIRLKIEAPEDMHAGGITVTRSHESFVNRQDCINNITLVGENLAQFLMGV